MDRDSGETRFLLRHRAHDYRAVVDAWRLLAAESGASLQVFAADAGLPVVWLHKPGPPDRAAWYLSAGIHGDEPAAVWGLIEWARLRLARQRRELVIFPCLNPSGLVANRRTDSRDRDLNRAFEAPMPALLRRWERILGRVGRWFDTAVCLHEDYDAQGIYCYELYRRHRPTPAAAAFAAAARILPPDPRPRIEGRRANSGLIRRAGLPTLAGTPEAFSLFTHWAHGVLTFETPSEYSFFNRVRCHAAFLREVERQILA
jgi:murein peptide amidase A